MSPAAIAMNTGLPESRPAAGGSCPVVGDMPMPPDFRYAAVLRRGRPGHGRRGRITTYDLFYMKHPPMECSRRAKLFAPFDALAGFSQCIKAKQELYCERRRLTSGEQEELDARAAALHRLTLNSTMAREKNVRVSITFFEPCSDIQSESYTEEGRFGRYRTITGTVCKVDVIKQMIILRDTDPDAAPGEAADNRPAERAISVPDIAAIEQVSWGYKIQRI